jgi:hypothetical protein
MICDSWVINDLTIGGKSPFIWLDEVAKADNIPPEQFLGTLIYREQYTHDIAKTEDEGFNPLMSAPKTANIVLSPLMAANWVELNGGMLKK